MSVETHWVHFFKPEVRKAGADLLQKDLIFLQRSSDIQVDANVRASTPVKVSFRATSIESADFSVDCTCPSSKKGQFCKHIWATLLLAEEKSPDFFDSKKSIEKANRFSENKDPRTEVRIKTPPQDHFKQKQTEYRKQAYQNQKQRLKEMKSKRSGGHGATSKTSPSLPENIQAAAAYFAANGFPMSPPFDEEEIQQAKRVLSKVFHPDKGGTQDEILELLGHAETLLKG